MSNVPAPALWSSSLKFRSPKADANKIRLFGARAAGCASTRTFLTPEMIRNTPANVLTDR